MIFSVKNLKITFEDYIVFQNLNFTVEDGDFVCIVGPNGCGKSTLLNCILGLIKASSGEIIFSNDSYRKHLGYLPQSSDINQNLPCSLYEVVSSGLLNSLKLFKKMPAPKIDKVLKKLNIIDIKDKKFSELSGGQRQKALLARAILASDNLLILDEPSNNLDHKSRQDFYKTLKELNKDHTILMVTHDLDHRNLLGNKILSLDPKNTFFGTTNEYVKKVHHDF